MEFYLKIHSRGDQTCVGICDKDIVGKEFRENKFKFHVSEHFFKDKLVDIEEVINVLVRSRNYNLAGKKLITELVKKSLINKEAVRVIQEVPIVIRFKL